MTPAHSRRATRHAQLIASGSRRSSRTAAGLLAGIAGAVVALPAVAMAYRVAGGLRRPELAPEDPGQ